MLTCAWVSGQVPVDPLPSPPKDDTGPPSSPASTPAESAATDEVRVVILWDADAQCALRQLGDRVVQTDDELQRLIRRAHRRGSPDAPVILDADARIAWQDVMQVMNLIKRNRIDRIEFDMRGVGERVEAAEQAKDEARDREEQGQPTQPQPEQPQPEQPQPEQPREEPAEEKKKDPIQEGSAGTDQARDKPRAKAGRSTINVYLRDDSVDAGDRPLEYGKTRGTGSSRSAVARTTIGQTSGVHSRPRLRWSSRSTSTR
jgi:biopolymer transport protein ExbD